MCAVVSARAEFDLPGEGHWYAGLTGGIRDDVNFGDGFSSPVTLQENGQGPVSGKLQGDIDYDNDHSFAVAFGYKYKTVRVEVEYSHRNHALNALGADVSVPGFGPVEYSDSFINEAAVDLDITMVNLYYETVLNDQFAWYGGAGLGLAMIDIQSPGRNDTQMLLAWQLMSGLIIEVSDQVHLVTGYRLFKAEDASLTFEDAASHSRSGVMEVPWIHSFEIGMRIYF